MELTLEVHVALRAELSLFSISLFLDIYAHIYMRLYILQGPFPLACFNNGGFRFFGRLFDGTLKFGLSLMLTRSSSTHRLSTFLNLLRQRIIGRSVISQFIGRRCGCDVSRWKYLRGIGSPIVLMNYK